MHYDHDRGKTTISVYYDKTWHQNGIPEGKIVNDDSRHRHNTTNSRPGNNRPGLRYNRCMSELALPSNWVDIEKRCSKIGHNGYRQKEVNITVKNLPLTHKNGVNLHRGVSAPSGEPSNSDMFYTDNLNLVTNVRPLQAKQIVSSKGTVRGFRNRVRAGIVTFLEQQNGHVSMNYL